MTLPCNLCTALGSDGLTGNSNHEHIEIHRRQAKYCALADCDFSHQFSKVKTEAILNQNGSPLIVSVVQKRNISRSTNSIRAYCNKLFLEIRHLPDVKKLKCAKCDQMLRLVLGNKTINVKSLSRHAIIHLQKSMCFCNHCYYESTTRETMIEHTQKVHGISGMEHFKDLTRNHEEKICKMIKSCFGSKDGWKVARVTSVREYMQALYRAKWWKQSRIRCNECGQQISVQRLNQPHVQKSAFKAGRPIDHACVHLGRYLYSCRQCTSRTVTERSMMRHLSQVHCLGETKQNFVSTMDANREDIIEMIERCFGLVDPAEEPSAAEITRNQKDIMCENVIHSRAGENKLLADRQIHSRRLITKFSKSGMITCRICSHKVNIMQQNAISTHKAFCHASTHVGKPLYRCRRCQKDILVMTSVYRHMKKEHGITKGVANEYDDLSDDLHQEIIDALTRSFDWSESPVKAMRMMCMSDTHNQS